MAYFAKDYNTKNELTKNDSRYISIILEKDELSQKNETDLINIMKNDSYLFSNKEKTIKKKYNCKIEYDKEGRVQKVICTKK